MPDTPIHPGPEDPTSESAPLPSDSKSEFATDATIEVDVKHADTGRFVRTWVWMIVVSGFGLFLVFGSVRAHYWDENARGTYYVPVTRGMQVLDIWRAQVNGLPEVAYPVVLKSVFLVTVFGFIGLSVIALWLATVEIWNAPAADKGDSTTGGATSGPAPDTAPAPGASAG